MVQIISTHVSEGVGAEIQAMEAFADETMSVLNAKSIEDFFNDGRSLAPRQYESIISGLSPCNIMDVGVGRGQSSVFLASRGHTVYAVEPNPRCCEVLERIAHRWSLPITVCQGVGEDVESIYSTFDAVFFNSSLHHCDDPKKALRAARDRLKPGGTIYLVNENFLRPWKTKAWFYRMLKEDPIGMAHYGGNEHSYHNWEYLSMLTEAGFKNVRTIGVNIESPLERLEHALKIRMRGERVHKTTKDVLIRFLYYILEQRISRSRVMARLSIVPCHFIGHA